MRVQVDTILVKPPAVPTTLLVELTRKTLSSLVPVCTRFRSGEMFANLKEVPQYVIYVVRPSILTTAYISKRAV